MYVLYYWFSSFGGTFSFLIIPSETLGMELQLQSLTILIHLVSIHAINDRLGFVASISIWNAASITKWIQVPGFIAMLYLVYLCCHSKFKLQLHLNKPRKMRWKENPVKWIIKCYKMEASWRILAPASITETTIPSSCLTSSQSRAEVSSSSTNKVSRWRASSTPGKVEPEYSSKMLVPKTTFLYPPQVNKLQRLAFSSLMNNQLEFNTSCGIDEGDLQKRRRPFLTASSDRWLCAASAHYSTIT